MDDYTQNTSKNQGPTVAMLDHDGRLFMVAEQDVQVCEFGGLYRCNRGPLFLDEYHTEEYRVGQDTDPGILHGNTNRPYLLHEHNLNEWQAHGWLCESGPVPHVVSFGCNDSPVRLWTTHDPDPYDGWKGQT